jgi:hypothetical protein
MMQAQSDKTKSDATMLTAQSNAGKNERFAAYEQGKLQLEGLDRHLGSMKKDRDLKGRFLETAAREVFAHRQCSSKTGLSDEAKVQATISPKPLPLNLQTLLEYLRGPGRANAARLAAAAQALNGYQPAQGSSTAFYSPPPPRFLGNPRAPGTVPPGGYVCPPWGQARGRRASACVNVSCRGLRRSLREPLGMISKKEFGENC